MIDERIILKEAVKLSEARLTAKKEFLKNSITVATGFLALFIGLKSDVQLSYITAVIFFITVILLVIGIVFLSISLYQEIYYLGQNEKFLKTQLQKLQKDKTLGSQLMNFSKKPWIYKIMESIGFTALIMSSISLIIYIYFLESI